MLSKGQVYAMESKIEIFRMCFFCQLIFGGVLTGHQKMFDEVGNDSVMRQACFVYTVRDLFQWTPEPGPDLVGS